jgi:hypothetical protein
MVTGLAKEVSVAVVITEVVVVVVMFSCCCCRQSGSCCKTGLGRIKRGRAPLPFSLTSQEKGIGPKKVILQKQQSSKDTLNLIVTLHVDSLPSVSFWQDRSGPTTAT